MKRLPRSGMQCPPPRISGSKWTDGCEEHGGRRSQWTARASKSFASTRRIGTSVRLGGRAIRKQVPAEDRNEQEAGSSENNVAGEGGQTDRSTHQRRDRGARGGHQTRRP